MNQEKLSTEDTFNNSATVESNFPKELPIVSPEVLSLANVKNVDELYNAYINGKPVEWPPWIIETDRGVKIVPQELYIYITDTEHILSVKLGNSKGIVLYVYRNGYYQLWTDSDCKAHIKSFLPKRIRVANMWECVFRELKTEYANIEEEELNANEKIINFRNGILNLETGKLEPHSSDYYSTIQIPCNYIPDLKLEDAPVASKFFKTVTGGNAEDEITLLEVLGLVISNVKGSRFKKLLILKGPGNTGKSVLRELEIKLVGLENTHTLDIKQLHSTFGMGGIYGKRLIGSRRHEVF